MIDVLVVGGIFREVLDGDSRPKARYGGSGFTAAVAAARFGAQVALAGYVGSEDEASVRAQLRVAGVDETPVMAVPGASGTFVFPTRQNGERPWPMYRPAEAVPDTAPNAMPKAKIVVLFGIPEFDPVASAWLTWLGTDVTLIWDRQGWLSRAKNSAGATALAPTRKVYLANMKEAVEDAEVRTVSETLAIQPPPGFQVSVIKLGVRGAVVTELTMRGPRRCDVRAFRVKVHSTIGAGDVFAGAFAARLAKGDSPHSSARWGCAASAIALNSGSNLLGDDACIIAERLLLRRRRSNPYRKGRLSLSTQ